MSDKSGITHALITNYDLNHFWAILGTKTRSLTDQRRVLDEDTRKRRQQRQLEALEKDNHHDDPHAAFAHLLNKAKLPSFSDGLESMQYVLTMFN